MKVIVILICVLLLAGCAAETAQVPYAPQLPQRVTLYRKQAGEIITLTCRDYIVGCLFAAIPADTHMEALKATASVISGNTLYHLRDNEKHCGADLCDESTPYLTEKEAKAEYGEYYDTSLARLRAAADYGLAHYLTCNGAPICAEYCDISTGRTEEGDEPWCKAVDVPQDKDCEDGRSSAAFSAEYVGRTLMELTGVTVLPARNDDWFSEARYTQGGTLETIDFCGKTMTGAQLQQAFELRSAAIAVEYTEARFVFRAVGIGSNTGMSLNAASEMADQGMTAEEILDYFYEDTQLIAMQ